MNKYLSTFAILIIAVFFLTSCETNGVPNKELRDIEAYISNKNYNPAVKTDDGLHIVRLEVGNGTDLNVGNVVNVNYKGSLLDDTVFDQGNFTFTLGVGQVVRGFDVGILNMEVGEKSILIFPSTLGYGNRATGSIPRNSPLVFEVEVVSVN